MARRGKAQIQPDGFLGVDVGKTDLFCHIIGEDMSSSERFDNSPGGIRRLIKWLSKAAPADQAAACFGQTGHYGDAIAAALPGLGETTVQIVLGELPDLRDFSDARQLAAWVGLTPSHFKSGTSGRTRTPITKIGSVHLRRALYMPAMTARVSNPLLKTFADRLIVNGRKPKQVIIAVMRKPLHQIYGILKSGEPYNPAKRGFAGA